MKPHHYLAIIVKIFAIVLFAYGIRQAGFFIEILLTGMASDVRYSIYFAATTAFVPITTSLLLWFFPITISKSIITPEIDGQLQPINPQGLLAVIISAIGLYTLFYAIVDATYWSIIYQATKAGTSSGVPIGLSDEGAANMIVTAIELVMAVMLILKSKTLAFYILRLSK